MSPVAMFLKSVALPAAVAAIAFVLCRWATRRMGSERRDGVAVSIALALGYVAGHLAIAWPAFPPLEVTDRLVWLAAVAVAGGLFASVTAPRAWPRWLPRLVLPALVIAAILGPIFHDTSQTWNGALWMLGLGVALVVSWVNLDALSSRLPTTALGLPLAMIAFGAAAALTLSGSIVLGQLSAALAASVAAVTVLDRRATSLPDSAAVYSSILGALLLNGFVYSELPTAPSLLLSAAPLALWVTRIGPIQRRRTWLVTLVALAVALVPVVVAVALSVAEAPHYEE